MLLLPQGSRKLNIHVHIVSLYWFIPYDFINPLPTFWACSGQSQRSCMCRIVYKLGIACAYAQECLMHTCKASWASCSLANNSLSTRIRTHAWGWSVGRWRHGYREWDPRSVASHAKAFSNIRDYAKKGYGVGCLFVWWPLPYHYGMVWVFIHVMTITIPLVQWRVFAKPRLVRACSLFPNRKTVPLLRKQWEAER
jgi:hypothetical protein